MRANADAAEIEPVGVPAGLHRDVGAKAQVGGNLAQEAPDGVGKPDHKDVGKGHVLSKVPKRERELLDIEIANAADAVELIIASGVDAAMQRYNGRQ